jgi:uncharacterized protein YndB with AHSA1/START domain
MMTTTAELTRIDRTIEIKAPPERVWRALTNAKELSTWFQVTIEGDITPGNEVWMTSECQGNVGRFRVRIVEMTPPTRFVWQWHPGAVDPNIDYSSEPRTTVTFTLEPSAGGTRVSLAETGFNEISLARRAKVFGDNNQGWTEVLVWLSNYAESAV